MDIFTVYRKGVDKMFRNLEAEIARNGFNRTKLAKSLEMAYSTLWTKMTQQKEFSLAEAEKIKKILNFKGSLDELFERD
jgi:Bacterial regulatory protein, Fis family